MFIVKYVSQLYQMFFQLDRRPWVDLSQSSPEKIRETVAMCPDGALSIPEKIQDIN